MDLSEIPKSGNNIHSEAVKQAQPINKENKVSEIWKKGDFSFKKSLKALLSSIKIKHFHFPSFSKPKEVKVTKQVTFSDATLEKLDSPKTIKISSSNVGVDAALGSIATTLGKDDLTGELYLGDLLKKFSTKELQENLLQNEKNINTALKKLERSQPKVAQFVKDVIKLENKIKNNKEPLDTFIVQERKLINNLVGFLDNVDNRNNLAASQFNPNKDEKTTLGEMSLINIYCTYLHSFAQLKAEYNSNKENGTLSFRDYITQKNEAIINERYEHLNQEDVGFLQEFKPEAHERFDKNFHVFSVDKDWPSLILNKQRFDVLTNLKGPDGTELKTLENKVSYKMIKNEMGEWKKVPHIIFDYKEIKTNDTGVRVYDDGKFGQENFTAAIAKDKLTGNLVLFCSIHIVGYDISNPKETEEKTQLLQRLLPIIEGFASANGVKGIVMGGDFNSVEERVTKAESPMTAVKNNQFVPLENASPTNVAPPTYLQRIEVSRKIDFIFYKYLSKVEGKPVASKGIVKEPLKDSLHQHQRAFDHETISGQVRLPSEKLHKQINKEKNEIEQQIKVRDKSKIKYLLNKQERDYLNEIIKSPTTIEQASTTIYRNLLEQQEEKEIKVQESYLAYQEAQKILNVNLEKEKI